MWESPAEVMVLQETCRRCGWCQGSRIVESSFIDFVLSPGVQMRDLDHLIFFSPGFFGLLHTRQSPRTHGRSMMPWSHDSPCPQDHPWLQAGWQTLATAPCSCWVPGKPQQSRTASSVLGITNLPVLQHRLSLSFWSFVLVERGSQRPLHKLTQRQLLYYVKWFTGV